MADTSTQYSPGRLDELARELADIVASVAAPTSAWASAEVLRQLAGTAEIDDGYEAAKATKVWLAARFDALGRRTDSLRWRLKAHGSISLPPRYTKPAADIARAARIAFNVLDDELRQEAKTSVLEWRDPPSLTAVRGWIHLVLAGGYDPQQGKRDVIGLTRLLAAELLPGGAQRVEPAVVSAEPAAVRSAAHECPRSRVDHGRQPTVPTRIAPRVKGANSTGEDQHRLPDLLTPGSLPRVVQNGYASRVGTTQGALLLETSRQAIDAVARGDFVRQVELGIRLVAEAHGTNQIIAAGHYLTAEGQRLLADLAAEPETRSTLLSAATLNYESSVDLLPDEPRAIRGLARIAEVRGELGEGLTLYQRAKGFALVHLSAEARPEDRPDMAHELLRTTRHYVQCLVEMRRDSPLSSWNSEQGRLQLIGYVAESARLHTEYMPMWRVEPEWSKIEWFMGLVLLARGWIEVGCCDYAVSSLCHALAARQSMREFNHALIDRVERANLSWWCATAKELAPVKELHSFHAMVERLEEVLARGDAALQIRTAVGALVSLVAPPWEISQTPRSA